MTVYSNAVSGEVMAFAIWDASDGKLKEATLDNQFTVNYVPDQILGRYTSPVVFTNTAVTGQQIVLNEGWTWTSFNVTDARFNNLNTLTKPLLLNTSDLIKSNAPALFDAYEVNSGDASKSGWAGTISSTGGVSANNMYKIYLKAGQLLNIKGVPVDLNTWIFDLKTDWNWLPFVVSKNVPIGDALANLNASDGDVIKSQSLFAIYSPSIGWKGSLTYLKAGEGYKISTGIAQRFSYPEYLNRTNHRTASVDLKQVTASTNGVATTTAIDEVSIPLSSAFAKFANTMSAVVKLPEGYQDLSFYNERGELRGISQTQSVQGVDLAFITIYGDNKDKLTAYIGSGNHPLVTNKTISFSADVVLGSINKPLVIDLLTEKINVYPNPFKQDFEIAIDSKEAIDAEVLVYNMFGQTLYESTWKINSGANVKKVSPNLPDGVYLLKVKAGDKVIFQKIIKN
jgi:hypothetical protein